VGALSALGARVRLLVERAGDTAVAAGKAEQGVCERGKGLLEVITTQSKSPKKEVALEPAKGDDMDWQGWLPFGSSLLVILALHEVSS
jgi:hypothetical protein